VSSFLRALHVRAQGDALRGQYADRRSEFEGSQSPFADGEAKLDITTVHHWTRRPTCHPMHREWHTRHNVTVEILQN
jgi:hypothetical protein